MSEFTEHIQRMPLSVELRNDFRDYAMSVITDRALPDVRDGLKPVHRRILYGMHIDGNTSDKPYRKAAKTVGFVMGNFHPHGDSSIYNAMARMSQPWNIRETLVDMHGNNGSMDGDAPAAMRYTEARLSKIAMDMLRDINKDTVDFISTYDDSDVEPTVLPSRFPQVLVNGTSGIAVGMATSIPSHNLTEVCEALIALIDNPDITLDELMEYIKGPDFPTGGYLMGQENIKRAYETGRTGRGGSIVVRSKIDVVKKKNKNFLQITEIPYQVDKNKLLEKLHALQTTYNQTEDERKKNPKKVIEEDGYDFAARGGIKDRTGRKEIENNKVFIEIELKADKDPEQVMEALYKKTQLQDTVSINLLVLVPNEEGGTSPKTLGLKDILVEYYKHQMNVVKRKYEFDLKKLLKDSHELAGLMNALDKLDETIKTIRTSLSKDDAKTKLIALLDIDEIQAEYVLERRLQTLANFEQDQLRAKYDGYLIQIAEIEAILSDENKRKKIIQEDLRDIVNRYGSERLTVLSGEINHVDDESLVPNDEVVMTLTHNGYIKRTKDSHYRTQRRKGRGVSGMDMYEDDFIEHLLYGRNQDKVLFFTNQGRVYETKMLRIKESPSNSRGYSIRTMFNFEEGETIQAVLNIQDFSDEQYLLFATRKGIVKKSPLSEYANIRSNGIKAINLDTDKKTGDIIDHLVGVTLTGGDSHITLVTKKGHSITFDEKEVSSIGRTGRGVKGITLSHGDSVIAVDIHNGTSDLLVVTDKGFGKRTPLTEFRLQSRGGKGVRAILLSGKNGTEVVGSRVVSVGDNVMLITKNEGKLMKLAVKEISQFQRSTQGTRIINLYEGDALQQIARISDIEDDEENEENEE